MATIPDDACLHCAVMATVSEWFDKHGERANGTIVIDVTHAISKLTECTVELSEAAQDRVARRRAFRFAHDALDANLKALRTGKLVELDIPAEH